MSTAAASEGGVGGGKEEEGGLSYGSTAACEGLCHVPFARWPISSLDARVGTIREAKGTEGAVLYICDAEANPVGLVKVRRWTTEEEGGRRRARRRRWEMEEERERRRMCVYVCVCVNT